MIKRVISIGLLFIFLISISACCNKPKETQHVRIFNSFKRPWQIIYEKMLEEKNDNMINVTNQCTAYFFRLSFGGGLQSFPNEFYKIDYSNSKLDSEVILINSVDTLKKMFKNTYSLEYSKDKSDLVKNEEFSNLLSKYNEDFFQNNQLVTMVITAAGGACYFTFKEAIYENDRLIINLMHKIDGMGHYALVPWFVIIETPKFFADTKIDLKINGRNW